MTAEEGADHGEMPWPEQEVMGTHAPDGRAEGNLLPAQFVCLCG